MPHNFADPALTGLTLTFKDPLESMFRKRNQNRNWFESFHKHVIRFGNLNARPIRTNFVELEAGGLLRHPAEAEPAAGKWLQCYPLRLLR